MNNAPDHLATLAAWWEQAEQEHPNIGDTVITHARDDEYGIFQWDESDAKYIAEDTSARRILARAKPTWADAPAVLAANRPERPDLGRVVWVYDGDNIWTNTLRGVATTTEYLCDVTPLYPR